MSEPRTHILFVIVGISAGTGTFCKSLGAGLRKHFGNELKVSLLTFRPDAKLPENASNFDETFVLSTSVDEDWRRLLAMPPAIFRLRRAVSEIRPDLIFTIGTFANVVSSMAIEGIPVVLSDHLNMTQRLSGARFGSATRWFMRRTYPDRLMIVASRELAEDLKQHFNVKRALVIPNGIDASVVKCRADEASSVNLPSKYFVSVGRLTEQKDVGTLIRAFASARHRGLTDELVIAGDGEERTTLETLARDLDVAPHTHFLGHISNPYPVIQKARGLVLSSIWEGFAYVPIEAMALGVPVISTACPSGPVEILGGGEFGMLVPPRDPDSLAAAMLKLSQDDAMHRNLAGKSLQRAQQLSVRNMSQQYREAFLSELQSHRRA
ncbi:MAG TPA: glycosyltransferase [Tepidisphaeraceae bacterium]|jgi:glycosyltransferase involved in cell wall biosynthesis